MPHGRSVVASLCAAAVLSIAGPAVAQDGALDRARAYFAAGMAYFEEGEYEQAIPQFERALEITDAPEIHYNLYVAHERLGHLDEAAGHLRSYLTVASAAERGQLERRLEALERRIAARAEAESPEGEEAPAATTEATAARHRPRRPRRAVGSR